MLKRLFLIPRAFKSSSAADLSSFRIPEESKFMNSFSQINFPDHFQKLLQEFQTPTEIQAKCMQLLMEGNDLIGIAPTGSGKTLAFALPALIKAAKYQEETNSNGVFTVIMCPTRQLSTQITEAINPFASPLRLRVANLYGGTPKKEQFYMARRANIIVATPGRLADYLQSSSKNQLQKVQSLILDEADRMLDMNFEDQLTQVVKRIPSTRQTLLFSATWDKQIEYLANEYIKKDAYYVQIGKNTVSLNKNIALDFAVTSSDRILSQVSEVLNSRPDDKVLIFCNTKNDSRDVAFDLNDVVNRRVNYMTSDLSQEERSAVLNAFREGTNGVLVATDVASRGIDVKNIDLVINYGFPNNSADFIHRVGRTGRGGKSGQALTFIMKNRDSSIIEKNLRNIANLYMNQNLDIPENLESVIKKMGYNSLLRQQPGNSRRQDRGRGGDQRRRSGSSRGGDDEGYSARSQRRSNQPRRRDEDD